jgi:hypothetical protein
LENQEPPAESEGLPYSSRQSKIGANRIGCYCVEWQEMKKELPEIRVRFGFSLLALLLVISFFAIAVTIGIVVASNIKKTTDSWFMPILGGAFAGFFCAWLPYFAIAQFYLRVIRGGPFHVRDRVEITNGPHKGKAGTILMADKERGILKVGLGIQSDERDDNYFEEFAIRRLRE